MGHLCSEAPLEMQELTTAHPAESRRNVRGRFEACLRHCAYGVSHILERKPAGRMDYLTVILRLRVSEVGTPSHQTQEHHSFILLLKPEKSKLNRLTR
jgi:hypothetical protein